MPLDPQSSAAFAFIEQADAFYTALTQPSPLRGGHLFYTGELTKAARPAIAAANIAGAATLSVSADPAAARQAMRDGIVDFVVNSLDEALRILKNELRKRETVAVCVTTGLQAIEAEMHHRGVRPDIVLSALTSQPPSPADIWLTLRPAQSPAQWLHKLDAIALAALPPEAIATRRWLERASRYLGRQTRNLRILHIPQHHANQLIAQIKNQQSTGAFPIAIEIEQGPWTNSTRQSLVPGP